ncbi:unnamed protein product [Caenorhabditis angaria]|uniref:DUSP domain-containing protein n=1 Tax=Caenorhabditis angaria TaxID=860376 RepID=A0A9P1N1Z5_9PELO|nr:unnamed protein product [Caenorhabditis angaria]
MCRRVFEVFYAIFAGMPSPDDFHMEDAEMENSLPDQKIAASPIPNKQELTTLITKVEQAPLIEDATWFIVSSKWWNAFIQAVHNGFIDDIGHICNEKISQMSQKGVYFLKHHLSEGADYQVIPEEVFVRLRDIFGLDNDARDYIPRQVVRKDGNLVGEIYPRVVHVWSASLNKNY